jgi:hypothetical protein
MYMNCSGNLGLTEKASFASRMQTLREGLSPIYEGLRVSSTLHVGYSQVTECIK